MSEWLLIVLMAVVTYIPRFLPFALAGRIRIPDRLEQALDFVPIAVLTAIIAQASLYRGGVLDLSPANYHALAALVAFVVALLTRHLFATIAAGLIAFAVLKLLF